MVQITMDTLCSETADFQTASQLIHPALGPTKDDRQLWLLHIHQAGHGIKFFIFFDTDIILVYKLRRQLFSSNLDMLRLLHKLDTDALDSIRHGR